MRYPTTPNDLRRRRLIVLGVAVALLVMAFVTYAGLAHRSTSAGSDDVDTTTLAGEATTTDNKPVVTKLPELRATSHPETFARQVAEALLSWDTSSIVARADRVEQLIAVADPTGQSTVGLASDLDNYLPTQDAWVDLAQYETRQWLTIDSIATPTSWAQAETQAGDALLPGTTAYTVRGARHRSGFWEGAPVETTHDVSFTVFIVCAPSYPACHLLRLSMLDEPLS